MAPKHGGEVSALLAVPGGVVAGGIDGTLTRWDRDAAPSWSVEAHGRYRTFALAICRDLLVSAGFDGRIRAWDLERGELRFEIGEVEAPTALAVGGDVLVVVGPKQLVVFDLAKVRCVRRHKRRRGHLLAPTIERGEVHASVSPRLVRPPPPYVIETVDVTTGNVTRSIEVTSRPTGLREIGPHLVAWTATGELLRWELATGLLASSVATGRLSAFGDLRGERLATVARDGHVVVSDLTTGAVTSRHEPSTPFTQVAFMDHKTLAAGDREGDVRFLPIEA